MSNSVQVNLQDSKGTIYDIEFLEEFRNIPIEVAARNIQLIAKQSPLRWRVDGEVDEIDNSEKLDRLNALYNAFIDQCSDLNLPALVIIPIRHQFGEIWEFKTTEVQIPNQTPDLFSEIKNRLSSIEQDIASQF
jgi:hypothetical protein